MASIHPYKTTLGEKRYELRWRESGRERSKAHIRLGDARRHKNAVESRERLGTHYVAAPGTFQEAEEEFYDRFVAGFESKRKPKPATIASTNESRVYLAPIRGHRIDHVDLAELEKLVLPIAKVSPRRAEMVMELAKRILRSAQRRRQPIDSSALGAAVASHDRRDPMFLTWEQVEELQSFLPEFISRMVPVAVLTLCRISELLALRDQDVDFAGGSIAVHEQLQNGRRTSTKTAAGRRTVDVGPLALRILREQQLAREPNHQHLLFASPTGKPFDRKRFRSRYFVPAAVDAHLGTLTKGDDKRMHYSGVTFHDLRHTGASLMIAARIDVKTIAEQMGHVDGGVLVLRRYGHLYAGHRKAAAVALENHVFATEETRRVGTAWGGDPR